jgi:hypothetical protein
MDLSQSSGLENLFTQNPLSAIAPDANLYAGTLQDPLNLASHSSSLSSSNLMLETSLESTQALAVAPKTFTVDSILDIVDANDGFTTLREAILAANAEAGADIINFNLGAGSQTITLVGGEIDITDSLTINGSGASTLVISANNTSRVFEISNDTNVNIAGLTIANGFSQWGGGIYNSGTLTVTDSTFSANLATFGGGGIYNSGTLKLTDSTLIGNSSKSIVDRVFSGSGGGILNTGIGILTVTNSTLRDNLATFGGGGIDNDGTLTVTNSTLSDNLVPKGLGGGIDNKGTLTVTNSTLIDNFAATNGGGIYNSGGNKAIAVKNSTIARNTAGYGTKDVSGAFTSFGYNLIGDGTGSSGFTNGVNGDRVGTSSNRIEPLFDLTVDILTDEFDNNFGPGDLSLREAIFAISPGGTITFASELQGVTSLSLGELAIEKSITIDGPSAKDLTISGNNTSRVFSIGSDAVVGIEGLTISNGFSNDRGGGIHVRSGGTLNLTDVTLSNNQANNNNSFTSGGGIRNDGKLRITNSTLSNNQAESGGGIFNTGILEVNNSTFSNNAAIRNGDAGLAAGAGGGIFTAKENGKFSSLSVTNSTFTGNSAFYGGGIVNFFNTSTVKIGNTIVAGNTSTSGMGADVFDTFVSLGYNLIGNGTSSIGFTNGVNGDIVGTSANPIDPKLGLLQDNGGSTFTHALLKDSPAINRGNPNLISDTDQNGRTRSQGGLPDIGAVERLPNTPPRAVDDFFTVRREATLRVLANDFDVDGDRSDIVNFTQPRYGTLVKNNDDTFTYRASNSFQRLDSFSYTISDSEGGISTATVRLNLLPSWLF